MADTWITDIEHFTDSGGEPIPAPARRLSEYLGSLIQAASVRPSGHPDDTPVRCRRRPGRRPCSGFIRVHRSDVPAEISWICPECGDNGLIVNWRKCPWDLSEIPEFERDEPGAPSVEVLLEEAEHRALRRILILDGEADRTILRARPSADGILLSGSIDEIEHLQGFVAAEANHQARATRARVLYRLFDRIEDRLRAADPQVRKQTSRSTPSRRRARGANATVYRLRVELADVRPSVWREVLVPAEITLHRLHRVLQDVMGWNDCHLHRFEIGDAFYGALDLEDIFDVRDERKARLCDAVHAAAARFVYVYDFGDHWTHEITVEGISAADPSLAAPICLAGERACPPEDVGGPGGYDELLSVLRNPRHPEFKHLRAWAGESFDPEVFDTKSVNARL